MDTYIFKICFQLAPWNIQFIHVLYISGKFRESSNSKNFRTFIFARLAWKKLFKGIPSEYLHTRKYISISLDILGIFRFIRCQPNRSCNFSWMVNELLLQVLTGKSINHWIMNRMNFALKSIMHTNIYCICTELRPECNELAANHCIWLANE